MILQEDDLKNVENQVLTRYLDRVANKFSCQVRYQVGLQICAWQARWRDAIKQARI